MTPAEEATEALDEDRRPGCNAKDRNGLCACPPCVCRRPAHGYGTACEYHDDPFTPTAVLEERVEEFCSTAGRGPALPVCPHCTYPHDPRPCALAAATACDCCRAMYDGHTARLRDCQRLDRLAVAA